MIKRIIAAEPLESALAPSPRRGAERSVHTTQVKVTSSPSRLIKRELEIALHRTGDGTRREGSGPGLQSAAGCRTIPRADGLAARIAAVRAHGVGRPRISAQDGAGSPGLFYPVRAWIARVGGVPLAEVRFFDPGILFFDLQVTLLDLQVTLLDLQVACLDLQVTFLDLRVTYLDLQVAFLDLQVTLLDLQVTLLDLQVALLDLQVTYLDPQVAFTDPRIPVLDPQVIFSDPRVLFIASVTRSPDLSGLSPRPAPPLRKQETRRAARPG